MLDISPKIERKVAIVDEKDTVLDAAKVMVERTIGSVVVTASAAIKGIFTERDLMRVVAQLQNPAEVKLKDVMRTDFPRVHPNESVDQCLNLMRTNNCRHLLVFEGEKFVGLVSLRDLVNLMLEEKEALIGQLTLYITS